MYTRNIMQAKDKLAADFGTIIESTEKLLQATASEADERVTAARARVQESIRAAKQKIAAVEDLAVGRAKAADAWTQEHRWTAVGVAAAVGALVGMLISRR